MSSKINKDVIKEFLSWKYDVEFKKRKTIKIKSKNKDAIYGIKLDKLSTVFVDNYGLLPKCFVILIEYLEKHVQTEGLFRINGSLARQRDYEAYLYNSVENADSKHLAHSEFLENIPSNLSPHDYASILKRLLFWLPETLLTNEYIGVFESAFKTITNSNNLLNTIQLLIELLPAVNRALLHYLLDFFAKVVRESTLNKMDVTNLAKVIGPSLFQFNITSNKSNKLSQTPVFDTINITEWLINQSNELFCIPSTLINCIYVYAKNIFYLNYKYDCFSPRKASNKNFHMFSDDSSIGMLDDNHNNAFINLDETIKNGNKVSKKRTSMSCNDLRTVGKSTIKSCDFRFKLLDNKPSEDPFNPNTKTLWNKWFQSTDTKNQPPEPKFVHNFNHLPNPSLKLLSMPNQLFFYNKSNGKIPNIRNVDFDDESFNKNSEPACRKVISCSNKFCSFHNKDYNYQISDLVEPLQNLHGNDQTTTLSNCTPPKIQITNEDQPCKITFPSKINGTPIPSKYLQRTNIFNDRFEYQF